MKLTTMGDMTGVDVTQRLRSFLESCPAYELPRIDVAARAVGCTVRTLQRRLGEAGLSYSRLVQEVRLSSAAERLSAADSKLVDIAMDAGYSDQANFTRAFRRWAGVPPSRFRRRMPAGPPAAA
jgi:AraC-like DNA-binding protein